MFDTITPQKKKIFVLTAVALLWPVLMTLIEIYGFSQSELNRFLVDKGRIHKLFLFAFLYLSPGIISLAFVPVKASVKFVLEAVYVILTPPVTMMIGFFLACIVGFGNNCGW